MIISELHLSALRPHEQLEFYAGVLGMPVLEDNGASVALRAGATRLAFSPADSAAVYHFAFNIAPRKFADSRKWLVSRGISLLELDGKDQFHSEGWNADNLYFRDPTGNIVEFIARHDLPDISDGPFSPSDLLCVSEIGVATPDVGATVAELGRSLGLPVYKEGSDTFTPMGGERGLLIVVREGRHWFPTDTAAQLLPLRVVIEGEQQARYCPPGLPHNILMRPPQAVER